MTDQTGIINLALQKLGLDPVVSINDKVKAARSMNTAYEIIRKSELRAHRWKFAIARVNLQALATAPLFQWNLQYNLPADCLRVLEVNVMRQSLGGMDYRTGLEAMYAIEGRVLLTNLTAPLPLRYMQDVTNTTLFDSNFVEAFACKLASAAAVHLVQNGQLKLDLDKQYKRALAQALITDGLEIPPEGIADDSFVTSRL